MTPSSQTVAMCYMILPGAVPERGASMPGHEHYNARCRRGEVSTRVVMKAEEVRVQNMTERANIPFPSEMNFCLKCHIHESGGESG